MDSEVQRGSLEISKTDTEIKGLPYGEYVIYENLSKTKAFIIAEEQKDSSLFYIINSKEGYEKDKIMSGLMKLNYSEETNSIRVSKGNGIFYLKDNIYMAEQLNDSVIVISSSKESSKSFKADTAYILEECYNIIE